MSKVWPEYTPEWIKPALGVDTSQVQELIGKRQASQLNGSEEEVPTKREAAVLMLLSGNSVEDGELLLTHRSPSMRSHSGQIAFPGGRRDPGDTSLVDTALREAWEETDLQRHTVTPLEQWEQLHIRATGNPVILTRSENPIASMTVAATAWRSACVQLVWSRASCAALNAISRRSKA